MKINLISTSSIFVIIVVILCDLGVSLNKYVDRFETLNYRPVFGRQKRSLAAHSASIDFLFRSHNRTFHLRLQPINSHSNDVFANDYIVDVDGEYQSVQWPLEFLYEGKIVGDPSSFVHGTVMDGIFDGHIMTGSGQMYTVEKAARYFGIEGRPSKFHSFIYLDDEINHHRYRPKRYIQRTEGLGEAHEEMHGCGLTRETHRRMEKIQKSAVEEEHEAFYSLAKSYAPSGIADFPIYSKNDYMSLNGRNRTKRQIEGKPEYREIHGRRVYEVRTCTIYLQADHKLYEHIYNKEGNRDDIRTRDEIISLLYNHIQAVNNIYENTDFNGIRGVNFVIQRTTIYTPQTCMGERAATSGNPFCEENVDVSHYLNSNSQKDHSPFCLAYALTYRDFLGGTLGLAWVASPSQSTAGGICQRHQRYNEQQRGGVNRSLNTGIITLVNYGNRVPPRVSQLTLAHEIGHNFGSPHDFPSECQPGLPDGNFIMFASATSGDKPNNSKFSPCSIQNISEVLFEVLSQVPKPNQNQVGRKRNCFTLQDRSFCGNQIREENEECDCGFTNQDCVDNGDNCCMPRENNNDQKWCKRREGKQCSPSEGVCCRADTCSYYSFAERLQCREESECQEKQFCNGKQAECPPSKHKANNKPCQDFTKVCYNGTCSRSICTKHGMMDCFLTDGKPEDLCQLACQTPEGCKPSSQIRELGAYSQEGRKTGNLLLPPGSPCNNYQGYCDIFRKCRSVDSNGPLARLRAFLFTSGTIHELKELVKEYWWACILIGICVVMFMALFVKCCAVHTPSTNPNKLPAQHFSDTLRHPGTLLRRGPPRGQTRQAIERSANAPTARVSRAQTTAPPITAAARSNQPARSSNRSAAAPANRVTESPLIQMQVNPSTSVNLPPINIIVQQTNNLPAEPPPPYQPTDPAAPSAPTPSSSAARESIRLSSIIAMTGPNPAPTPLPGAPPPVQSSSALPLIPGPPHPGQGPKPGRRKPKPSPQKGGQQQNKKARAPSADEKEAGKRNKRAVK